MKDGGNNMKYITLIGIVTSAINVFLHFNNDPAFWGWLSSTAWAMALFIHELTSNK